jgi:hypothetical protein
MPHLHLRRALFALAAAALVTACNDDRPSPSRATSGATQLVAATTIKARIHLTGLILIVPPNQKGAATNILLPIKPGHSALLGVGYDLAKPPTIADFCRDGGLAPPGAMAAGICYVDLAKWDVAALGDLPATTNPVDMEQFGALNVTQGSGGRKVVLKDIRDQLTSLIVFNTGEPKETCSLGRWMFKPNGGKEQPHELANVIMWDMTLPSGTELVFTRKDAPHEVVRMPLIAFPGSGGVELVLAHVPAKDVADLPPTPGGAPNTPVPGKGDPAPDFDAFYNLLGLTPATPNTDPQRPLPKFDDVVGSSSSGCKVHVSNKLAPTDTVAIIGVKTYACMPASAELGP